MTPRTPAIGTRVAAILTLLVYGAYPYSAHATPQPPVATAPVNVPAPLSAPASLIHTQISAGSPSANGPAINAGEDIRDIRGLKYVLPAWLVPAILAGAVLLAVILYGLWRWYRRRRRPRILLPFELALQRLEDIRTLMQPAQAREFSIAVSDIVRSYLEQRFEVTATHRTTEEFLHDLLQSANPSLARHRGLLANFLEQCDLAKFAGMSLTLQSMESLHHSARTFVLETAKPDPPESAKPSASPSPAPARTPSKGSAYAPDDTLPNARSHAPAGTQPDAQAYAPTDVPFDASAAPLRHGPSQPGAGQPIPRRAASKDGA